MDESESDTKSLDTYPRIREQDRLLPIANVNRIMKRGVPENAKISKGAKETIQECVSELIGFITSEASEIIQEDKRKTITAEDLVDSMQRLGFAPYRPYLNHVLKELKNTNGRKIGSKRSLAESNEESNECPESE